MSVCDVAPSTTVRGKRDVVRIVEFFDSLRDREAFSTVSGAHWRCGAQLRLVGDFRSRVPVRDSLGDGRWRHVE